METTHSMKKYEENLLFLMMQSFVLLPYYLFTVILTMAGMVVVLIEQIFVSSILLVLGFANELGVLVSIALFGIAFLLLLTSTETNTAFTLIGIASAHTMVYYHVTTSSVRFEDFSHSIVLTLNIFLIGVGFLGYYSQYLSWPLAISSALIGILGLSGTYFLQSEG